jgi:glycerophosphoryl diester phosphodiesterase
MIVPQLVAHRGYASRFPENTLESLEAALEAGACFVEFDVQLTRDGCPVLLHDFDFSRTGGRDDLVCELSLQQVLAIEVGQPEIFGNRFAGAGVPTLAGALRLVASWDRARAFVEIKPESLEHFGLERVAERVLADFARTDTKPVLISSVGEFLVHARRSGHAEIGLVLGDWSRDSQKALEELQPQYVFCNLQRIPAQGKLWPGAWKWVVYEVVSPRLALELAERGADLIETMAIGEMLADPTLGSRSCRD